MGEIRFVDTGETRGFPYLVCKKKKCQVARSLPADDSLAIFNNIKNSKIYKFRYKMLLQYQKI